MVWTTYVTRKSASGGELKIIGNVGKNEYGNFEIMYEGTSIWCANTLAEAKRVLKTFK